MNRHLLIYFALIFAYSGLRAQVNDAGLWASFSLEKKFTQTWSASFSQELRLNENLSEVGTVFSDAGVNYKFNKKLKLSFNYRYSNKRNLDDSYSQRHRFYLDLTMREKLKPFVFTGRIRFQQQYEDIFTSENGFVPQRYLRPKLTCKLDMDKSFAPFISAEYFSPMSCENSFYLDKSRYMAGVDYQINSTGTLELFYLIQRELNQNNPLTDYVVGLGYSLEF